jgi:hypothetical protein
MTKRLVVSLALALLAGTSLAQPQIFRAGGQSFVYTGVLAGRPATCTVGQLAFITDATAGQNIHGCTETNTWTLEGDGGGAGSGDVTAALNFGTDNSCIRADGTTKGVQGSGANCTIADTGVVTAAGFVGPVTGSVTGNASTASALAANPADCAADTYAQAVAANGDLTCSTVTNAGLAGSIALTKLATQSNNTLLGNISGGAGVPTANTLTATLDAILGTTANRTICRDGSSWAACAFASMPGSTAQGDVLYLSAADTLARLAKDTNTTRALCNTGASNNPAWCQLPIANGISGLGTGVATALAVNTGSAGAFGRLIAAGTSALGTSAIASGACASAVTTAASGVLTTDVITAGFNGDPTAVTGYAASANGMLTIIAYPSADNVNFKVCNNTGSSITPGAITLNWRVAR